MVKNGHTLAFLLGIAVLAVMLFLACPIYADTAWATISQPNRTATFNANGGFFNNGTSQTTSMTRAAYSPLGNGNANLMNTADAPPENYCVSGSSSATISTGTASGVLSGQIFTITCGNPTTQAGYYYAGAKINGGTDLTNGATYTMNFHAKGSGKFAVGHERGGYTTYTLTSSWQTYSLTFTASGSTYRAFIIYGQNANATISVAMPIYLQAGGYSLPTPTCPGRTFLGWFTAESGGTQITGATRMPNADTTYYAHWSDNSHTLTLDANNGVFNDSSTQKTYTRSAFMPYGNGNPNLETKAWTLPDTQFYSGTAAIVKDSQSVSGYAVQVGRSASTSNTSGYYWSANSSGGSPVLTPGQVHSSNAIARGSGRWDIYHERLMSETQTLSSTSTIFAYSGPALERGTNLSSWQAFIVYGSEGTTSAIVDMPVYVQSGETSLPTPTRMGYTFEGWYTATSGGVLKTAFDRMPDADQTLYARWSVNQYNLTIDPNGGVFDGSSEIQDYEQDYSSVKTLATPIRTGYSFIGWIDIGEGKASNALIPDGTFDYTSDYVEPLDNRASPDLSTTFRTADGTSPTATSRFLHVQNDGGYVTHPGYGGFHIPSNQYASDNMDGKTLVICFEAKVPEGLYLHYANNRYSSSGVSGKWLTDNAGTGTWRTYAYELSCSTGVLKSFGFTYFSPDPDNTWYETGSSAAEETGSFECDVSCYQIFEKNSGALTYEYPDGDTTLKAMWAPHCYTLEYNANGGTGVMDDVENISYEDEFSLTPCAFTRTGYKFIGWNTEDDGAGIAYADGQDVSGLVEEDDGSITLYAQWVELSTMTISKNADYNGSGDIFSITVSLTNADITLDDVSAPSASASETSEHSITFSFSLQAGQQATISSIPFGTGYAVSEPTQPATWNLVSLSPSSGTVSNSVIGIESVSNIELTAQATGIELDDNRIWLLACFPIVAGLFLSWRERIIRRTRRSLKRYR